MDISVSNIESTILLNGTSCYFLHLIITSCNGVVSFWFQDIVLNSAAPSNPMRAYHILPLHVVEPFFPIHKQGHSPKAHCIRHTLDPVVPFNHRPLTLYALLGTTRAVSRVILSFCGFRRLLAPCGRFRYWHREASEPRDGPIVFFHGVCSGLPVYLGTIWKVCRGRVSGRFFSGAEAGLLKKGGRMGAGGGWRG